MPKILFGDKNVQFLWAKFSSLIKSRDKLGEYSQCYQLYESQNWTKQMYSTFT